MSWKKHHEFFVFCCNLDLWQFKQHINKRVVMSFQDHTSSNGIIKEMIYKYTRNSSVNIWNFVQWFIVHKNEVHKNEPHVVTKFCQWYKKP